MSDFNDYRGIEMELECTRYIVPHDLHETCCETFNFEGNETLMIYLMPGEHSRDVFLMSAKRMFAFLQVSIALEPSPM